MKIVIIDNYDSFTYNLSHLVKEAGAEVTVLRNDQFHGTILLLGRVMRPSRSHDLPHLEIFTCAGFLWAAAPP